MRILLKRSLIVLLAALLCFSAFFAVKYRAKAESAGSSAQSYAVIERKTGRVLKRNNAEKRLPMASTTKIATAITVIENTRDLYEVVIVPAQAQGVEGSSIYLKAGEKIRIIDLLYGLMLQSGNDCAVALAVITSGSIDSFAGLMNDTAKKAGACNTNFTNPHGLHDDNHYTTAIDLAKITAYAMNNPTFREIVSTKRYCCPWDGRECDRVILNKNKILSSYEGGDGVKTGYTRRAGRCLVSSATRNGMQVIAVVLNCPPMFEECRSLMDEVFSSYEMTNISELLCGKITAEVKNGKEKAVELSVNPDLHYPMSEEEKQALEFELIGVNCLYAPVENGMECGKINIYIENKLLFCEKLFTIKEVRPNSFDGFVDKMPDNPFG